MDGIPINPEVLRWARKRALLSAEDLVAKFPKFEQWERGEVQPSFKQLESFARKTHVPFGFLFLPEPPQIPVPLPDFRTLENQFTGTPSPDMLETIYHMQRRQTWLRETRIECAAEPLTYVGTANITDNPVAIGKEMRLVLGLEEGWAKKVSTWEESLSLLRNTIEEAGILTVINGIVGNNTHRILNVAEFRGFALYDEYAPLIFINGADTKSAQMFTMAHELAHIWLGQAGTGLSGYEGIFPEGNTVELFCDKAAAEFLVPERALENSWPRVRHSMESFENLARQFKVSPIVIARRAMDLHLVEKEHFFKFYEEYSKKEQWKKKRKTNGGSFFNNQNTRIGKTFALQVIRAAKEGRIGFKEAYELTGLHGGTFQKYAQRLGISLPQ